MTSKCVICGEFQAELCPRCAVSGHTADHIATDALARALDITLAHIEVLEMARLLAISEWSTWKDVLVSNMTEADWQETMNGLRVPAAEEVPDDSYT